jgi:hemoglobin
MKKDLESREDVKLMVDSFYEKVNRDKLLGPIFNDFAGVNWDSHLEKMYDFWNTILFARGNYKGSPFPKHAPLPIQKEHFDRWIKVFHENMDEHFEGPKATDAKSRVVIIGYTFHSKMNQS